MRLFNGLLWGFAGVPNVAWHLRGPSCQSRTCSWLWEKVSPGGLVQQRDSSGSKLDHWCDLVGFKRLRFHGNWTTLWDFVRFHAPASYVFVATQHAHELATGQIHPEQSPEALVSWSLMARYSDYSDFRILWEDKPPSTSMSMIYNIHIYIYIPAMFNRGFHVSHLRGGHHYRRHLCREAERTRTIQCRTQGDGLSIVDFWILRAFKGANFWTLHLTS